MQEERADRYEVLKQLASMIRDELVVLTYIGATSFEWEALKPKKGRSAHIGQMGDVCGLALGLALALPHRRVVAVDGDGSLLLELAQLASIGRENPKNLVVIVLDNECYESIGWGDLGRSKTVTSTCVDLAAVAKGCGIQDSKMIRSITEFRFEMERALREEGPRVIVVKTAPSPSKAPPRQIDGYEEKYNFVRFIELTEGIRILNLAKQDKQLMKN